MTDGTAVDWEPAWSADSSALFFLSDRDGSRCIWMQRLRGPLKHPAGPPTPLKHFHRAAARIPMEVEPTIFRLSETHGRLVLTYMQGSSSIYTKPLK